jgi:GT2 family glycosyltransferase
VTSGGAPRPVEPAGLTISVVVPVRNGASFLSACLDGLLASKRPAHQVIVVDDASTDDTAAVAGGHPVTLLRLAPRAGAAAARNAGARVATGDALLFVDADVVVRPDTVGRVAAVLGNDPGLAAVFGSYDDSPADSHFVSQYRNLLHHFVHQHASPEATTFWTGCGAVRRDIFQGLGGFDPAQPFMEDIELGYRLRSAGHRIRLDRTIQVKHLKPWRFWSMLRADIFGRAVPWSRLLLERGQMVSDLNLGIHHRVSALASGLAVLLLLLAPIEPRLLVGVPILLATVVFLNRDLFGFLRRRKGLLFAAGALPLHVLYYLYSSATFVACWIEHHVLGRGRRARVTTPGASRL